jgi:hypothetical protein
MNGIAPALKFRIGRSESLTDDADRSRLWEQR